MNVGNVSIARGSTNPAILERIRDTHDDKNHISFARIPLNVYTTRSDVQVSSLSIEDFPKASMIDRSDIKVFKNV